MAESRRPRNLIPLLTFAGVLAIAAVIAIVLLLNRAPAPAAAPGAGSPTPEASTPSPAAPTPAPSETPSPSADASVRQITLTAEGFDAVDRGGNPVFSFAWSDEPETAVAALSEAFGSEPTKGLQDGDGSHFPDYTLWQWSGFELGTMVETPDGKTRTEYDAPAFATFTANAVGDVEIVAEFGLRIGDPLDEARAAGPHEEFPSPFTDGQRLILEQDRSVTTDPPTTPRVSIIIDGDKADRISSIAYEFASKL
ncbi:hypothetical protein Q9S71_04470 [Microbacterium sp. KSW4-11]|uniref:Uncharacterized protein n=1 Tax=Microbacterium gawkjiense TaxID=3067309 RepID=A0ABU3G9C8_9MICO|nr:hypothetical protein [Microbacterium sp. KSW4-11]MDT3316071.1 hypothetical protein [Microbacterium sp. KSW4-11]